MITGKYLILIPKGLNLNNHVLSAGKIKHSNSERVQPASGLNCISDVDTPHYAALHTGLFTFNAFGVFLSGQVADNHNNY